MSRKIGKNQLIDKVNALLTLQVVVTEFDKNGSVIRQRRVMGRASSFRIKTNFEGVKRKALINALYVYEQEVGSFNPDVASGEVLTAHTSRRGLIKFFIEDYSVEYYSYNENPIKIKRVKRKGSYFNYVYDKKGKIVTYNKVKGSTLNDNKVMNKEERESGYDVNNLYEDFE